MPAGAVARRHGLPALLAREVFMPMTIITRAILLVGLAAGALAHAERAPVLQQIDLPHPYYYREMYLPQLTGGPGSLAWSPDSRELIYAMAGSLWRQKIDEESAEQLTSAAAYDYQPDWSPDGRWVIYCSYRDDAVELWALDLKSGAAQQLTRTGAVNTEPRFSPDGKHVVFTSTQYQKRFHVFVADFNDGKLENVQRLTGEHKSSLPRYYYSAFDHEINPVWTRDGREIIYVSNRNHIYGTGGFWRTAATPAGAADPDRDAREFHYEETNWKARPDPIPRRDAAGVQLLPRALVAQPVAPARGWRRCVSDRLRRLGYDLSALVARRDAHRIHLEQERQHGDLLGQDSRRPRANAAAARRADTCTRWRSCDSICTMRRGIPPPRGSASPMPPAGSMRRPARGSMRTTDSTAAGGPSSSTTFMRRAQHRSMCRRAP